MWAVQLAPSTWEMSVFAFPGETKSAVRTLDLVRSLLSGGFISARLATLSRVCAIR